jgi:hypothetical protein
VELREPKDRFLRLLELMVRQKSPETAKRAL